LLTALKPKYKIMHANALNKKAITALEVRLEHQMLIAPKTAARRNKPIYEPAIAPLSIHPVDDNE
jgi:hypothetical protein